MKQVFVLLLVSIIATQKQSHGSGSPLHLGAVKTLIRSLAESAGLVEFNAEELKDAKLACINGIKSQVKVSTRKIKRLLRKNKKCGVGQIRTYYEAMVGHIHQLKTDIHANTKLLTEKTNATLASLTKALSDLDKAIKDLLTPECKTSCMRISTEANFLHTEITRMVKDLHTSCDEHLRKVALLEAHH